MKVKDILKYKGPEVLSISENKTLYEGMKFLALNKVGALMVLNSDAKPVGIISERDFVRAGAEDLACLNSKTIAECMTTNVIYSSPEEELETIEAIMIEKRIRHIPILKEGHLIGIISIGDAVKAQLALLRDENKALHDYIGGGLPKG